MLFFNPSNCCYEESDGIDGYYYEGRFFPAKRKTFATMEELEEGTKFLPVTPGYLTPHLDARMSDGKDTISPCSNREFREIFLKAYRNL